MCLFNCLPLGTIFLAPLAGAIPSAEGLVEGLKHSQADIAFIVPSIVLELAQNPDMVDYCAQNLEYIMYCRGDLPQHIGDVISSKIKLVNQYGATELGICPELESKTAYDPKDWKYVQFHPDAGYEFRPAVGDTYELCVVRNPALEAQQPSFTIFPGTTEYCSRDLFTRHPAKPDLWSWKARADDIIVFLNGEKTNPISMEHHVVAKNPEVTAALVIGTHRFQAALLLEINMSRDLSIQERAALIEKVWPSIEEANQECPAHAKIAKSHILFTTSDRPVLRSGKGTIQRSGTLHMYKQEINALYADADKIRDMRNGGILHVDVDDHQALSAFVRDTFASAMQYETIHDKDDFFQLGLDSFQALLALRTLRQVLKIPDLALSTIYTNPSVETLLPALVKVARNQHASEDSRLQTPLAEREALLREMQRALGAMVNGDVHGPAKQTVILTGSTGALGSYILAQLLNNPSIDHIYCLNRGANSEQLQSARNATRGLSTACPADRVTFLTADLTKPSLGLESTVYERLHAHVALIIHAAWPVNFNLPLSSFRSSLIGLVNIMRYAAAALQKPHLHYVSSIGSVIGVGKDDSFPSHNIPEEVLPSSLLPRLNGYSESKYVAELLLAQASSNLGLSVSLSRVGQVAGAINGPGLWNPQEWFPSLVVTSAHIGALPQSLGKMDRIDWLPIDVLASVLIELTVQETVGKRGHDTDARVFNLAHPHPSTWSALLPSVIATLNSRTGKEIKVVPYAEWISLVRKDIEEASTFNNKTGIAGAEGLASQLKNNPAVKLLAFYEDIMLKQGDQEGQGGATILNMDHTLQRSKKLRSLAKFQDSWVAKWIDEWMTNKENTVQ
jgi:thioester reductase-like protein